MPFKLCFLSHLLAEYVPLNGQQTSLCVPSFFAATGPKTSKSEHESLQIRNDRNRRNCVPQADTSAGSTAQACCFFMRGLNNLSGCQCVV